MGENLATNRFSLAIRGLRQYRHPYRGMGSHYGRLWRLATHCPYRRSARRSAETPHIERGSVLAYLVGRDSNWR